MINDNSGNFTRLMTNNKFLEKVYECLKIGSLESKNLLNPLKNCIMTRDRIKELKPLLLSLYSCRIGTVVYDEYQNEIIIFDLGQYAFKCSRLVGVSGVRIRIIEKDGFMCIEFSVGKLYLTFHLDDNPENELYLLVPNICHSTHEFPISMFPKSKELLK